MTVSLTIPVVLLYLTAGFLLLRRFLRGAEAVDAPKGLPLGLALGASFLHAAMLHGVIFTDAGMNLGFFHVLSLVADIIAMLLALVALHRPVENLGIVLLPIAAVTTLLQAFAPPYPHVMSGASLGLQAHILLSILSYSLLSIAALQAVLLAVQDRNLRNRHPGGLIRALPPLETMEGLLFQMIGLGFFLLTLALISGAHFLEDMFAQHLVHKTVLSIAAWGVFATLLLGRWHFGWRGRTAIRWTLGGFVTLMLAYFGSKMVLEFFIGRT